MSRDRFLIRLKRHMPYADDIQGHKNFAIFLFSIVPQRCDVIAVQSYQHYVLEWVSRFTLGLNAAKNTDNIQKMLQTKVVRN